MKKKRASFSGDFPKKKLREIIIQMLYSIDAGNSDISLIKLVGDELEIAKRHVSSAYAEALVIYNDKDRLDKILISASENCPFGQVTRLEKNVMRLIIFEFLALNEDPSQKNLLITEAIRLVKKFSTSEASKFINAVLDCVFYPEKHSSQNET
ncbi:MAG: transcription antitermination protein NusB [Victivallaceae bacterium]